MRILAKGTTAMQIHTLQDYELLHVDNPDYLDVLQGRKDRLIEILRCYGMYIRVKKT
jgi:hypothetical protein